MEHYALKLPAGMLEAPAGAKVARVESREGGELGAEVDCEVLQLVGFQSFHVYHYTSEEPRPVEAVPELMSRNGWHYRHCEIRLAPVAVEREGRIVVLSPEEESWTVLPPDSTAMVQEERCEELKRKWRSENAREGAIEQREQGMVEGD